jgi:CRISPR-associated protein Csm4
MSDIVYLKPKSLFPRSIPSDTLVGAIYYGISEIYGQESINDFIENEEPPILISSAFPYVENNGNKIHFLPKLIVKPGKLSTDLLRKMKRFKKASFIHEEIFNDWINGRVSEGDLIEGIKDKHEVKNGLLVPKNTGLVFNIKTVDRAHNLLNRLTSKSEEFFYASSASFKNSGLFFLTLIRVKGIK